jgi:hypothetical protein
MEAKKTTEYKGMDGYLILSENELVIKRGLRGFLLGGGTIRGDKTVPYHNIVAVQFKKSGILAGYIQLSLKGGNEAKAGILEAGKDENTITFAGTKSNDLFEEAKKIIEKKMNMTDALKSNTNNSYTDLEKLADLRDKGVITNEDYNLKKKQILGI